MNIRRLASIGVVVVAGGWIPCCAFAQTPVPDVDRVMDYIDDLYRSQSSYSRMRMTVVRERGTRELEMESWSRGDDEALIVIRSPAREAGAATLRTEEGLWNYAPRADRLIRIPSGLLSESWMGSHFTNDDLMRETSYLDDYDATLTTEELDGVIYLKATLIPKPDAPVVYTELVFFVTTDDWVPVRSEYYDEGELVRAWAFDDIRTISGKKIPLRMTVLPVDEPEERTVIEYLELELDVPVEGQLFTRQGLRRAARG
ncbi:MAG: outer membrane lipoprotein-sorting protein [Gemmatimonadetes bacterium]|nr:outer membrane lipoprotein-sorting protein [Gemmatimonadota bacterium]NNM06889.1 outer membrane lipoprotein-sorting protein [Gemmatimonadota bacterium]